MVIEKIEDIKDVNAAESVVRYAYRYNDDVILAALDRLKKEKPESDLLPQTVKDKAEGEILLSDDEIRDFKLEKAKDVKTRVDAGIPVEAGALEESIKYIESVDAAYEGPDKIKDSATAEKNFDAIKASLDALEEKDEEGNPKWLAIVKEYTDKVDFSDDNGEVIEGARREAALETLWRTTKTNILVAHTLDWEWMKKFNEPGADKEALMKDEVEDYYALSLMKAHEAEKIREPEGKEKEVGTDEYIKYMEEVSKNSLTTLKEFLDEKKEKIKIGLDKLVAGAAHAWAEVDSLANHLDIKGYAASLVNKVKEYRNEFGKWMSANHPKLWERMKAAAVSFKANKHQMIGNLVATGAYTIATVTSVATANPALFAVATKAYAGYMAAGSAVWPAFQKRHIEREQARKRNEDVTKWNGLKGLGNAMKSIFSNKHEALGYVAKVGFGVAAAQLTFGIANSSMAKLGLTKGVEFVAATKTARFMSSVVRASASVMSQATTLAVDAVKYFVKPNEINKAYYEQSKTGFKWALAMAGASVGLQALGMSKSGSTDTLVDGGNGIPPAEGENIVPPVNGGDGVSPVDAANGTGDVANGAGDAANGVGDAANGAGDAANGAGDAANGAGDAANGDGNVITEGADVQSMVDNLRIPSEYNENMGITEAQWNRLPKLATGIYSDRAELFGFENKSPDEALAQMYMNIANAKNINPDLFKDLSQVDTDQLRDMLGDDDSREMLSKIFRMKPEKLDAMLENNPDAVQDLFGKLAHNQNINLKVIFSVKSDLFKDIDVRDRNGNGIIDPEVLRARLEDSYNQDVLTKMFGIKPEKIDEMIDNPKIADQMLYKLMRSGTTGKDALDQLASVNNDLFKDMPTEQVLYSYLTVGAHTTRATAVGAPEGYLISMSKDGQILYATRQESSQMLDKIILCGDVPEDGINAHELDANLSRVDIETNRLTGEGSRVAQTHNSFAGDRGDCGATEQRAWKQGIEEVVQEKREAPRADGTASGGYFEDVKHADGTAANGETEVVLQAGNSRDPHAGPAGMGTKTSQPVKVGGQER